MSDRLSIENRVNEKIIPIIDQKKFLGLGLPTPRMELFQFAMAVGINEGYRTPLATFHGFILENSIKAVDGAMSSLYSVLVNELRASNEEDKISEKDLAFKVAEEYANTGFNVIEKWLENADGTDMRVCEETLSFELMEQMDGIITKIEKG